MEFLFAVAVVFGIGMGIRWLVKKRKAQPTSTTLPSIQPPASPPPAAAQPSFCTGCGQPVKPDSAFCPNCGNKVR